MSNTKIIRLEAANFMKLSAVEITPDPKESVVTIGGKNEQGKSAVLNAIQAALGGKKFTPNEPIKKGEAKAQIVLETEDLIIQRVITEKTDRLEVKGRDGQKKASPQKLLDELFSQFAFDPLEFAGLGKTLEGRRRQAAILRELTGVDFEGLDNLKVKTYNDRTLCNKEIKNIDAALESITYYRDAPEEEVSIANLSQKLQEASTHNAECNRLAIDLRFAKDNVNNLKRQIEELTAKLTRAKEVVATCEKALGENSPIDTEPINQKIQTAEETNRKVRNNQNYNVLKNKKRELESAAVAHSKKLEEIEAKKVQQLAEAKMPVEGLSFTQDGVFFREVPFDQCSSEEKLRVSVAMGFALNPELKIALVREGSLLDEEHLDILKQMAADAGGQIWLEVVGSEGTVVIEGGEVVSAEKGAAVFTPKMSFEDV